MIERSTEKKFKLNILIAWHVLHVIFK
jgi:hypothetical protein